MELERVCGTCKYGAEAFDRFGNTDDNYVICKLKEAENRGRKPNRFQTTSAVTRMHCQREACNYWKAEDSPLSRHEQPLKMNDWQPQQQYQQAVSSRDSGPLPTLDSKPSEQVTEELKQLKLKVLQQDQMISSFQTQNIFLAEQISELQTQLAESQTKLEKLQPFDPAIFAEVNYFALLGISEKAPPEEIKDAYRQRMKFLHPDRFINIAQRINTAYETLMDPSKRQKYLQQIRSEKHV